MRIALAWAALAGMVLSATASTNAPQSLWFEQPAKVWSEALPIGDGYMGAMIFGGVPDERIQFNEHTLWTGHPHDYVRAGAREALPEIRRLLEAGQVKDAEKLAKQKFLSDPIRQKAFQPCGDLRLHFFGEDNVTEYRRELDLESAVARVTYRANGVNYKREAFASYPDRVIVWRMTASQPGSIHFTLRMTSPQTNSGTRWAGRDTLALSGQVESNGVRFEARARVMATGGTLTTNGEVIEVDHADAAWVVLTAATSVRNFDDISADPARRCAEAMERVAKMDFARLFQRHEADYRALFGRVGMELPDGERAALPTDARLRAVKTSGLDGDEGLAALYFQYGRYLLIASSRAGSEPATLQGVWNELLDPPWESKYTLNINCEMNYWPAEVANLGECAQPLFAMIDDLAVSGGRVAREQYGCGGWVVNHNTDLWRGAAPINGTDGIWPTGAAWLCQHLWEHYLFTGDREFLARRAYPDMKKASQFFLDYLVKDAKTGWLVTSPSFSPEEGTMTAGPTMDEQLVRALFEHTIGAAGILRTDREFAAKVAKARDQLAPNQVGQYGQLQEWLDDLDKPNNNHRHMSPLWALFPGADITPDDPKIFEAAKVLLKWRGDGSTGWSFAWRMPLWARAGDGDFAWRQLNLLLQKRTLPNLFDLCGPFQIDGNFGATAGMAEMLLQSERTTAAVDGKKATLIELLPALPKAWPEGSVRGLRARGGFEVDEAWTNGQLTQATIRSTLGNACEIACDGRRLALKTKAGASYTVNSQLQIEPQ